MYPGSAVRIEIGGENGTAVTEWNLKTWKFREERPDDKDMIERVNGKQGGSTGGGSSATDVPADLHALNIHHILTAWEEGKEADTCGPEARKAVAIILAMYESARQNGTPIAVKH
jgi:hypothetical protein